MSHYDRLQNIQMSFGENVPFGDVVSLTKLPENRFWDKRCLISCLWGHEVWNHGANLKTVTSCKPQNFHVQLMFCYFFRKDVSYFECQTWKFTEPLLQFLFDLKPWTIFFQAKLCKASIFVTTTSCEEIWKKDSCWYQTTPETSTALVAMPTAARVVSGCCWVIAGAIAGCDLPVQRIHQGVLPRLERWSQGWEGHII